MLPRWAVVPLLAASLIVGGCSWGASAPIRCPGEGAEPDAAADPDGRLVWHSEGSGACAGIYSMRPDGSGVRLLVRRVVEPFFWPLAPRVSPDGLLVAFVGECGGQPRFDLCVMEADGSHVRMVAPGPVAFDPPAWSRDGTRIAFGRDTDAHPIDVVGVDGTGTTTLVGRGRQPAWSPDGTQLAFVSDQEGPSRIYLANADGSDPVRLTDGPHDKAPAWSPDGTRIAFSSGRAGKPAIVSAFLQQNPEAAPPTDDGQPALPADDIYVMHADGTGLVRITDGASDNLDPEWSPDGTRIAFSSLREGDFEIYLMQSDGTGVTRLTRLRGSDRGPSWTA